MDKKADEWEDAKRKGKRSAYKPARVIGAGTAGTGKSRTTRAIVRRRRERTRLAGHGDEAARRCCSLAAPTGCASFQMQFGAATAHRVFGVPAARPFTRLKVGGAQYKNLRRRLELARLFILDERSMIGRMFLGKIAFRLDELFGRGEGPAGATLGFRDFMMMGDDKQCDPIGDSPLCHDEAYKGQAKKVDGGPAPSALVGLGLSVRNECDDVVILHEVHRLDDGDDSMGAAEREAYRADADKFVRVCRRLADCEMTREDHAWMSRRNRSVLMSTEAGRREYASFRDAILLMDGRKRNVEGKDGADQVNAVELRRLARDKKRPIAAWGALHGDYEEGTDPTLLGAEEFSGLAARMELCELARVLLTDNLWPEAGLMNGALGTVRGFVWPEGADPTSKQKKLSAPLCVVVDFFVVRLKSPDGGERTFFPGEPDKKRWVPIFMREATSTLDDKTSRHQFPLVLAWAITHWKAQGMTLPRVRVRLGGKCAAMHGVGFVALTRVRHPTHMVFEEDLPEWEVFQGVRETATFHRRRRFELRLQARASRTIRKYGFCEVPGQQWSRQDADRAAALLKKLEVEREKQRTRLLRTGRRTDDDAFLWDGEPDYAAFLSGAAKELGGSALDAASEIAACQDVVARLLAPTRLMDGTEVYFHLPAVQEALGALIPEWLHPSQDDPKKRGKKRGFDVERVGVHLTACGWKMSVFKEEALREHKPLAADTMEFFSVLARHVCKELGLPIAIGSIGLGARLTSSASRRETCERLIKGLKGFASWRRSDVEDARDFLVPVPLYEGSQCREWLLLTVSPAVEGRRLGGVEKLQVRVAERCGRKKMGIRIAQRLHAIIRDDAQVVQDDEDVVSQAFPADAASLDTTLAISGLIWAHVAEAAGVPHLDLASPTFLVDWRSALCEAFARLRLGADARGDGAVEKGLVGREACLKFLEVLGKRVPFGEPADEERPKKRARNENILPPEEPRGLKILTWNIAGRDLSNSAPKSWSFRDKLCALRREILRLQPDVLALQEVPGSGVCAAVPEGLVLIGAAEAHPSGCFAQLYCRPELDMRRVGLPQSTPAVSGRCTVNECEIMFVSAHLFPSRENDAERAREVRQIFSARVCDSLVLLGDLNVRPLEVKSLCDEHDLRAMPYSGCTWDPRVNKFYENLQDYRRNGEVFDQVLSSGCVWVEGHRVGNCYEYRAGKKFHLSDHFGLLGFVDVHAAYGTAGGGQSHVAENRRAALGSRRTQSAAVENILTRDREMSGERNVALEAERAAQRERGQSMKAQAKKRKEREERLRKDREEVFGASSILGVELEKAEPPAASRLELEALRDLPSGDAQIIWKEHVPGGHHALNELRLPQVSSFAPVVVQLLLRMPAVSAWLAKHAMHCEAGESEQSRAKRCVSCALWLSRGNFNERDGPGSRKTFVPLFVERGLVGKEFARGGEHDIVAFLGSLLQGMRRLEVDALRATVWPGMSGAMCTHVDRLFAHVGEERRRCARCGAVSRTFASAWVLPLPEPSDANGPMCVTDLYTEFCRTARVDGVCRWQCECGSLEKPCVQRRVASTPNVLIVQVPRFNQEGEMRKFALEVEEELYLPGLDALELYGIVYHQGARLGGRDSRYTCACRGPDWRFWHFDGDGFPTQEKGCITTRKTTSACLLVYAQPGGLSTFAGAAAVSHQKGDVSVASKDADAVRAAVSEIAKTVVVPEEPKTAQANACNQAANALTAGDAGSEEWAQEVARADWKCCLGCHKKWHKLEEIEEFPKDLKEKGMTIISFRCSVCQGVREATASESGEKRRRLAEDSERCEEVEMEAAAHVARAVMRSGDAEMVARSSGDVAGSERDQRRRLAAAEAEQRAAEAARRGVGGTAQGSVEDVLKRQKKASVAVAQAVREAAAKAAAEKAAQAALAEQKAAEEAAAAKRAAAKRAEEEAKCASDQAAARKARLAAAAGESLGGGRGSGIASAGSTDGSRGAARRGGDGSGFVYMSGEEPPAEGARPAWALRCFQSLACSQTPDVSDARLLALPVARFYERLLEMSQEDLVRDAWLCGDGVTRGIQNLGGNACFVNSFMQVLVRLEPFVRVLRAHHHRILGRTCVLCKILAQIEDMRRREVVACSSVTLAARAGEFRIGGDFIGDATTGEGPQCDVWEFCMAVVEEVERWEKGKKQSCFREEDEVTREAVEARSVFHGHVWGALIRTRNRCALCEGTSDSLMHRQFVDLNLVDGIGSLHGLYENYFSEFRGAETVCPVGCRGGLAYTQYFLEREPPVLFFRLLRFRPSQDYMSEVRINRDISIPEKLDILRSGPYQIAAVVMHHGVNTGSGHYTTLCWEGSPGGEGCYRWYSDEHVGAAISWDQVQRQRFYDGSSVGFGAYILCYVRLGFWGDAVGDGSERTPYARDVRTVDVAKSMFRGKSVGE